MQMHMPSYKGQADTQGPSGHTRARRTKMFVSDKIKSGCHIKVSADTESVRDQKLLRMRSTLGGYLMMQQQTALLARRSSVPPLPTPPTIGTRQKDRPLSSYLSGGASARIKPVPHQLEPLPLLTGNENFKARYDGSKTERRQGGGMVFHNGPRGFFPLALALGMRPQTPLVGVGGEIGKLLDDSPNEQVLPGKKWSAPKALSGPPRVPRLVSSLTSVGCPSLVYALQLEDGSDEKDWWRSPGDLLAVGADTVRMLPKHCIFNGAWERAVVTLCNLHFLAEKVARFGIEDVMRDLNEACAGLDVECKKFPDLKSWQDTYGTWRSQCHEYKKYFVANATAMAADVSVIFSAAVKDEWGTCSQDATFALKQAQASVGQLRSIVDAAETASDIDGVLKVSRLVDHVRIACKHGLHTCDESGKEWKVLLEKALKTVTNPAWVPKVDGEQGKERSSDNEAKPSLETESLHGSLTAHLQNGMKMTESLAATAITGRPEPRWYCTHINDSYVVKDLTHLIIAIDAARGGNRFKVAQQLPGRKVRLYLSTMGSMTVERNLLTSLVLPATAKYLMRAGVQLSWTDLRSAGPDREFTKNCIVDAIRGMNSCLIGEKLFALIVTAASSMLSEATVYRRERPNVNRLAAQKQTELDKSVQLMVKLQTHLRARFDSIFEAWTYFDINGDWNVTTAEFVLEYKKLRMPIHAKDVLKVIDKDGYGDIDVHEFVTTLTWHDLPGGGPNGTKEAIDKTVIHYALRRTSILKEIHARLAQFQDHHLDDDLVLSAALEEKRNAAESAEQPIQVDGEPARPRGPRRYATDAHSLTIGGDSPMRKNRVTSMMTQKSADSKKSAASQISQEIVQDSVLGSEILQEAATEEGLDWVSGTEFVNSRLQRLELEHVVVRNADRCQAIVFQRALPAATRPTSTDEQGSQPARDGAPAAPLQCLGDKALQELVKNNHFFTYSLRNSGSDMGAFALRVALAVVDTLAANIPDAFAGTGECVPADMHEEQPGTENEASDAQGSADVSLWQEEKQLQSSTLSAMLQSVSLVESKLDSVHVIWKEGLGDESSIQDAMPGEFTRQECVSQLGAWARNENGTENTSRGALELAIMRGEPGCGLSTACAMLIRHLGEVQEPASANSDIGQKENTDFSVFHYFRRSEYNHLGPDSYLLSEVRGNPPFSSEQESQVGLSRLAGALLQEAQVARKDYVVLIDGLSLPDVALLVSGCSALTQTQKGAEEPGSLRLLVTLSDPQAKQPHGTRPLPRILRDVLPAISTEKLRFVRCFSGLSERERCALLHSRLGSLASKLSAERALVVCRLQGAALPEFICVAAAFLKEISGLIPPDEAVMTIERTLENLYEFNILAWLEMVHGPKLVASVAEVVLRSRVYGVSIRQLRAVLAKRKSPRLMDAETVQNLADRLERYCKISPDGEGVGLMLKSNTLRKVLGRKYKMTTLLDEHELHPAGNQDDSDAQGSSATKSTNLLDSTSSLSKDFTQGASEEEGFKHVDMDAVRSAMQALITKKLHQQIQTRIASKPVPPPTPEEDPHADDALLQSDDKGSEKNGAEGVAESPEQLALLSPMPGSEPAKEIKDLASLLALRPRKGLIEAPVRAGPLPATSTGATPCIRETMKKDPTLEGKLQLNDDSEEETAKLLAVRQRAALQQATEERMSSLTHGVCLDQRHMWEALQASKLLPELDAQILASETVDENNPIPDMMLIKHRNEISGMKARRQELIKLWEGAKMDVLWIAVSVCNLDVSCRLEAVPPGVYKACWHLKLNSGISDFPDINCTLHAEDPAAPAGPPAHAVLTQAQQDAVKTDKWCFVVVANHFYVAEACDVIAALHCQGKWLSGLAVDFFALVPVPRDEVPPLPKFP
jgi:hypothetical protein